MSESLNQNLTPYLRDHRLISALVTAPGVWVLGAPQSQELPYITYSYTSAAPVTYATGVTDLVESTYRFECWGATPESAHDLGDALVRALSGFRGFIDDIYVRVCTLQSESQEYIPPSEGSDQGTFAEVRDFRIWFLRAAPTTVDQPMRQY